MDRQIYHSRLCLAFHLFVSYAKFAYVVTQLFLLLLFFSVKFKIVVVWSSH